MTTQPIGTRTAGGAVPARRLAAVPADRLGERLARYRAVNRLTIREAGERVGASHWVWAQWESGVVPSPAYLRRVATVLGLTAAQARELAGPDRVRRPSSLGEAGSTALSIARFEAGMSASELARRVHVSLASVSRWESGERSPCRHHWPRLATALAVDVTVVAGFFAGRPAASEVAAVTGLVALRRRRRLTQVQLARAVRVDVSTVQRWEHEGRAPRARAIRVAEELGVALTELARPALVAAIPAPVVPPLGRLRRRTHLPVSIVAARVGVSRAALRAWERGTNRPSWPHARALARVLAVAPMEVFDAAGLPAPAHLDPARWTVGELPQILRELRRWRGLTQDQLAATVGVSTATIGAWESGRQRPRRAAMHRLDCALGVAPRLCDLGASC